MIKRKIRYISDSANWVIDEIGRSLESKINSTRFQIAKTTSRVYTINHYATRYGVFQIGEKKEFGCRNIITYFHGDDSDLTFVNEITRRINKIDLIHTSCEKTKLHLTRNGIPEKKVAIVPIGIEVDKFRRISETKRLDLKLKYGFSKDAIVVGSFQKDGCGWEEGMEPKLEKGPDVFCDAVVRLRKEFPVEVLLTGFARGYVKQRLKEAGVPFRHIELDDYNMIGSYYNALDLYVVSSRLEGGPRAPMECQASGVPVVSTNVGQVDQMIENNINGVIVDVGNVEGIVEQASKIIKDSSFRNSLIEAGLKSVKQFDYEVLARRYLEELYGRV